MLPFLLNRPAACLLRGLAGVLLLTGCNQGDFRHLVIDAGSSGSRFCTFEIVQNTTCHAPGNLRTHCYKLPGGLADLNHQERVAQLDEGLQVSGYLSNASEASQPDNSRIVLLGTGGFRRLPVAAQRKALRSLQSHFHSRGLAAHIQIIQGDTEGRLAWYAMREYAGSNWHSILETGGATVQAAYRGSEPAQTQGGPARLQSISAALGMNSLWSRLENAKGFQVCQQEHADQRRNQADACKAFLAAHIKKSHISFYRFISSMPAEHTVYGLGATWRAVFGYADQKEIGPSHLAAVARNYCSKSNRQIEAEGVAPAYARRACFVLSFHSQLLDWIGLSAEQTGGSQPATREGQVDLRVRFGPESWPRGASIQPEYFEHCGGAGKKAGWSYPQRKASRFQL